MSGLPAVRVAPAKLNLTLAVLGRRPDGFHAIHSVMVPVGLADRLSVAAAIGPSDTLHVEGADCGAPESNLVLRAIAAAREAVRVEAGPGAAAGPLAARLEKRISVAAGLAGGSSDAAAALDAALEAWGVDLSPVARHAAAASIGSDVAFFGAGGWALVEGRGERVERIPSVRGSAPWVLIVTPAVAVPTPAVYAAWAGGARGAGGGATAAASRHLADELRAGMTATSLLVRAGILAQANDLAAPALHVVPALVAFRRGLVRTLGAAVGQSGSGPTAWVLYPSREDADAGAAAVRDALADGRIVAPGDAPPAVHVASLVLDGPVAQDAADGGRHP